MMKMLEHKGWISYSRDKQKWFSKYFNLDMVDEYFKDFQKKVMVDLSAAFGGPPPAPQFSVASQASWWIEAPLMDIGAWLRSLIAPQHRARLAFAR